MGLVARLELFEGKWSLALCGELAADLNAVDLRWGLPGWFPILVASVGPLSPPVPKGRECTYALSESSSTWHAGAQRMHMHMC